MPTRLIVASLVLLLVSSAHAQWQENGRAVPDSAWRRSDGDFGAMLLITKEVDSFLEEWSRPASPGYIPNIQPTGDANRGDTVAAMILFTRCRAGSSGNCRAEVDFRVLRPDGTVYAEFEKASLWDLAPPHKKSLQLSETRLMFEVEADDPIGTYQIHVTVRDRIALREVRLYQELAVGPGSGQGK